MCYGLIGHLKKDSLLFRTDADGLVYTFVLNSLFIDQLLNLEPFHSLKR